MSSPNTDQLAALRARVCGDGLRGQDEFNTIVEMAGHIVRKNPTAAKLIDDTEPAIGLVSALFAHPRSHEKIAYICAHADSPAEFAKLIYKVFRSLISDRFRQTDRGALHRRLRTLLAQTPDMEQVPKGQPYGGTWRIAGTSGEWDGSERELHRAAAGFEFERKEWKSERRRPPGIADEDLADLVRIILHTAGGPLSVSEIARVCSERVGIGLDPSFVGVEDRDFADENDAEHDVDVIVKATVEEVLAALSDDELADLRVYRLNVRAAGEQLGCSKTTAATRRTRLETTIADLLGPDLAQIDELIALAILEVGQGGEV